MSAINVNPNSGCGCSIPEQRDISGHYPGCHAKPVPVPCPIPPSVEMKVVLGECTDWRACKNLATVRGHGAHVDSCPARPISVTCSISGEDWAKSDVNDAWPGRDDGYLCSSGKAFPTLLAACRARWALVKALVTGAGELPSHRLHLPLFEQRDAVFAALVKASRAEDALTEALGDYEEAMRGEFVGIYGLKRESHGALERYVERVIEQVGNT